jgi:glycosyltransferase involved in cell wall biosynthesis
MPRNHVSTPSAAEQNALLATSLHRPPPRILVVSQNASIPRDRRVSNELRALAAAGYEVVAICPQGDGFDEAGFERREGIDIFRYRQSAANGTALSYLREYATAFWRIRRLTRRLAGERGFDVVQASNPPDFLLLAVHFLKRRGTTLIFDHHDLAPELLLVKFGDDARVLYRLTRLIERLNFLLADFVLATNESYKRIAVERGGMRPEAVFVVRSGPQLARFGPVGADPALKRGRQWLISFIGEMAPQDGVDHALRALADLLRRRDDWHAIFAGDGGSQGDLIALSRSLGLDDHVEFTGWLEDPELKRVLSSSDICLAPDPKTPLSDASTLVKIAEYMAMSRPVVCYDLAESRVTAGDAASYARPNDPKALADAIDQLLDDPRRRALMGRVGRERVEQVLSWDRASAALLGAYQVALARPNAAGAGRGAWRSAKRRLRRLSGLRPLD